MIPLAKLFLCDKNIEKSEIYHGRNSTGKNNIPDDERQSGFAKNIPTEQILPPKTQ